MSYCRWSSDDWKCDLYCYEAAEGYCIHVVGRRRDPLPPPITADLRTESEAFWAQHKAQEEWMDEHEGDEWFKDIDLPHAGESFYGLSLQEFKEKLLCLRGLGYSFPEDVLRDVDEEIAEMKSA